MNIHLSMYWKIKLRFFVTNLCLSSTNSSFLYIFTLFSVPHFTSVVHRKPFVWLPYRPVLSVFGWLTEGSPRPFGHTGELRTVRNTKDLVILYRLHCERPNPLVEGEGQNFVSTVRHSLRLLSGYISSLLQSVLSGWTRGSSTTEVPARRTSM